VQAALQELQQVLAGDALHPDRLVVVAAELALGQAVDPLDLLLLAQLRAVVRDLATARLPVLAGRVGAALVAALVRVAAVPLEEQLHVFAPAEPANRSRIVRHVIVLVVGVIFPRSSRWCRWSSIRGAASAAG